MSAAHGREKILIAAEDLFVAKGFVGTSMSEIAERAGVAKSLIYHHFESKQALWQDLIRKYHERSGVLEKLFDTMSADDFNALPELVTGKDSFFAFLKNHPRVVRLYSWLALEQEFDIDYPEESIRQQVLERVRLLQRKGLIRREIDPGIIPVIFLSLMMHWFSSRRYLIPWLDGDESMPDQDSKYIEGVMDILMRGLTPVTED